MKILTANRLINGEAVWFTADRSWAPEIDAADLARDKEAEERLEQAGKAAFLNNEVLDVEMVDVELVDGRIRPIRLRERIRAAGPSMRPDLGKQAARPALVRAA